MNRLLILLDKCRRRRAPAQRLDAEGTGARVEIETRAPGTTSARLEKITCRMRSCVGAGMALRRFEVQAAGCAGDNA